MADTAQSPKLDMDLVLYFTEDLLRKGHTKLQVEKMLVEKGLKPDVAGSVVEKAARTKFRAKRNQASMFKLGRAIALLVTGFGLLFQAASAPDDFGWIAVCISSIFFGLYYLYDWNRTRI